ncbi:hypothetical protein EVAR_43049_1 [Eumeta japonica]|uniref:Uncharacterized protein n=1 Tax=Eumeta variegata TaxID=151549 RepID=A0A4C1XLL9_EUMVA|nr:hypothetical protein EVAR_43049_1 [Eumeta japonica]
MKSSPFCCLSSGVIGSNPTVTEWTDEPYVKSSHASVLRVPDVTTFTVPAAGMIRLIPSHAREAAAAQRRGHTGNNAFNENRIYFAESNRLRPAAGVGVPSGGRRGRHGGPSPSQTDLFMRVAYPRSCLIKNSESNRLLLWSMAPKENILSVVFFYDFNSKSILLPDHTVDGDVVGAFLVRTLFQMCTRISRGDM